MSARVRQGLRRQHNWVQLVKFCAVGGSGYVTKDRIASELVDAILATAA